MIQSNIDHYQKILIVFIYALNCFFQHSHKFSCFPVQECVVQFLYASSRNHPLTK
jgi:hypothetical protein